MEKRVRAALESANRSIVSCLATTRKIRELVPGEPKHGVTISTTQALTLLGLLDSMDDSPIGRLASERGGMNRVKAGLIESIAYTSRDAAACRQAIEELLSLGRTARQQQFSILHPSS